MFFLGRKVIFLFLFAFVFVHANEGGEHGEQGEKEEKSREPKAKEDSFGTVLSRVLAIEAKVRSSEDELKKLIQEKQRTKDQKKVSEIIKQMIAIHRDLQRDVKEYERERALLNYRYPEKGQSEKRRYERIEVKSLEEMEGQMSLSSSVKKTMEKVRSQYGISEKKQPSSPGGDKHDKQGADDKSSSPAPQLTDPVILKK